MERLAEYPAESALVYRPDHSLPEAFYCYFTICFIRHSFLLILPVFMGKPKVKEDARC
jgi:hypothetical protein